MILYDCMYCLLERELRMCTLFGQGYQFSSVILKHAGCAGKVAAAAIVSPLLIALIIGGVIATLFLIKKENRTKTVQRLSTLWRRITLR